MSYVRDNEIKEFLTLVKNNTPDKIYEIMNNCCKALYVDETNMSCMKYECEINTDDNKLHHMCDNIKITIIADEKKSEHLSFGLNSGKEIIILIPLSSIDIMIPINTRHIEHFKDLDIYQSNMDSSGYYYIDKSITEGNVYDEHDTDQATIIINYYIDIYADNKVVWNIISSNDHKLCVCWKDYDEYIKFYSHIIHLISNNLGKDLLDKLNI